MSDNKRPKRPAAIELFGDNPPNRKRVGRPPGSKNKAKSKSPPESTPPDTTLVESSGGDCDQTPAFDSPTELKRAVSKAKHRRGKTHSVEVTTYSDGSTAVGSAVSDADTSATDENRKRGSRPVETAGPDGSLLTGLYGSVYSQRGTRG